MNWKFLAASTSILVTSSAFAVDLSVFRSLQLANGSYDSEQKNNLSSMAADKFISDGDMNEAWGLGRMAFDSGAMAWGSHSCTGPTNPGVRGQSYAFGRATVDTPYRVTSSTLSVGTFVNVVFDFAIQTRSNVAYNNSGNAQIQQDLTLNIATPQNANAVRDNGKVVITGGGSGADQSTGLLSRANQSLSWTFQTRVGDNIYLSLMGASRSSTDSFFPKVAIADGQSAITWAFRGANENLTFVNPNGNAPFSPGNPGDWIPSNPVPEPASIFALVSGVAGFAIRRKKKA